MKRCPPSPTLASRRLLALTALLVAVAGTGCSHGRDVTADTRYHGGYQLDGVYRLQRDVSIVRQGKNHWSTGTPLYLADPSRLPSIENSRPGDRGVGTATKGTRLRLNRFVAYHTMPLPFYSHDLVRPVATILDGPNAGDDVDIAETSGADGDALPRVWVATLTRSAFEPIATQPTRDP
jgi:hypothetical protein